MQRLGATHASPEQAAGTSEVDGRTDVYALGSVLYEMFAGKPPFSGFSAQIVLRRKLSDSVPSLRALRDTVLESFEQMVQKALARDPEDRFATAAELVEALRTQQL